MLSAHLEQQIGESDTSFMMAAAAKEVPDSSSNHSRDDSSSGGDGSSSLRNHTVILGWNTKLVHRSPTNLWVFSCLLHSRSIFSQQVFELEICCSWKSSLESERVSSFEIHV
jgi:hypothetical protein